MSIIYNLFQKLKKEATILNDDFVVISLTGLRNHKLGITSTGNPVFFIQCSNTSQSRSLDTNLEHISIQFNRSCQLIDINNEIYEGTYTVVLLKSSDDLMQEYFLKIVFIFVKDLSDNPTLKDLKVEIDKLIYLFSKLTKPRSKSIQGLWSEMLLIEQSSDPDYLLKAWHVSPNDRYDFNDGFDKIEVKSTAREKRIHSFSLEQLSTNKNSNLLVVSILTSETDMGVSVYDLLLRIENRLIDSSLRFKLNDMVATTLGVDFDKSHDFFYDYQLAKDSIRFYRSIDIPTIKVSDIPECIKNVNFECDLTDLEEDKKDNKQSKLFNAVRH